MGVDHAPGQEDLEQRDNGHLGRDEQAEQHHHEEGIAERKPDAREGVAGHG